MSKRKALGRGLSALLPENQTTEGVQKVSVERLASGFQPRKEFRDDKLDALAQSIREKGVLQPLVVRREANGFRIIAGERRWRASKLAGLKEVPVVVREASHDEAFMLALVENLQREDLNPIEEAEAYHHLVEEQGLSKEQVAKLVGRDRSTVTNTLRLLKLPEAIRKRLADGRLSEGHGRALLAAGDERAMLALAERVEARGLSVRETERLARAAAKKSARTKPDKAESANPEIRSLEEKLQRKLQTRVRLKASRKGKGRLEIEYHSLDELDRILDILLG